MVTNADCTIYNQVLNPQTRVSEWKRTFLYGVFWQEHLSTAMTDKGRVSDNTITVYIPFNVGCDLEYLRPAKFKENPDGKWTLAKGDILLRGICNDASLPVGNDKITVLGVETFDYGSLEMRHWEVTGK